MPLLEVKSLVKHFPLTQGLFSFAKKIVHAVNDVSLTIEAGETFGLVGESGSGKSTLARAIIRLIEPDSGTISFENKPITFIKPKQLKPLRREIQFIFQDPYSSLNPRMNIAEILSEGLKVHRIGSKKEQFERVLELLKLVGLSPNDAGKYPREFSGGQRQRIGIARALSVNPKLIICDEPLSALDVSIQAQILNLLSDLQKNLKVSYLFISHDLRVIPHMSHRIGVMYLGSLVEVMPKEALFNCVHPYTQGLLNAIPKVSQTRRSRPALITGEVPSPIDLPNGCTFHPRCPYAQERCRQEVPALRTFKENHRVACHFAETIPPLPV